MNLPEAFKNRMKQKLADSYDEFEASFEKPPVKGFHLNTSVISRDLFEADEFGKASLSWERAEKSEDAYIYSAEHIGSHPFHHAGIIYSQDPAAMSVVSGIEFKPGERVLDLCAAPGGKSSQIAARISPLGGRLLSNEVNPSRNQILVSNMERMGYDCVSVSKLMPDELAVQFPSYFDTVLVDAPCSGEGMFRKYPESIDEWSIENVMLCAKRQREILSSAVSCLKPGGRLIYSTCTYADEEDEDIVDFLTEELSFSLTAPSRRYYPHEFPGEGQFCAYLQKAGGHETDTTGNHELSDKRFKPVSKDVLKAVSKELGQLPEKITERIYLYKDSIVYVPEGSILPDKAVTSFGIKAGKCEKGRFIPEHAFFKACGKYLGTSLELAPDSPEIAAYLRGEEFRISSDHEGLRTEGAPFGVITVLGVALGGFKLTGNRVKNHYPKGLRNTF